MNKLSVNKMKAAAVAFAIAFGFSATDSFGQETPSKGTQQTQPPVEQTQPTKDQQQTQPTMDEQAQPTKDQQTQPKKDSQTKTMESANEKQMGWSEYKQDLRAKYQKVMDQVDNMRKQATEKNVSAEFTEALDRFEARAKVFADHLKNTDSIPADKQEEFRSAMKDRVEQLNEDFNMLKERWASINK